MERALDAGAIVVAESAHALDDVGEVGAAERALAELRGRAREARLGDAAEIEHDLEQLVQGTERADALAELGGQHGEQLRQVVVRGDVRGRLHLAGGPRRGRRDSGTGPAAGAGFAYHAGMATRALAGAVLAALFAAAPVRAAGDETLVYRWRLDGLVGALAGLFVPNAGEGLLTLRHLPEGRLRSELTVTAEHRAAGDYFRYGAEWDPATGTTLSAWSSQRWRGEEKSKRAEVGQTGVIDVASAVHMLRLNPPAAPRRLEIWSDGKLYPVSVVPHGHERRRVEGREIDVRHLTVRGVALPDRRLWKGSLDLWLTTGPEATPVEILVARSSARVRLELVERRDGIEDATTRGDSR